LPTRERHSVMESAHTRFAPLAKRAAIAAGESEFSYSQVAEEAAKLLKK
jgi:hypothetical protein